VSIRPLYCGHRRPCLAYSLILKIEAKCSSETSGYLHTLHYVTNQKTVLVTVTTERISNPTMNVIQSASPKVPSAVRIKVRHTFCRQHYGRKTLRIVTCMSGYRRDLDWSLDLLTTYTLTTRDYFLQITDAHRPVSLVYYSIH
jgi:hypothetical protein